MTGLPDEPPGPEPAWRRYLRFLRPDVRGDVDDELDFHLEMRSRELAAAGLPPERARAEAARAFGDLREIRDACITIDRRRLRNAERRQGRADMIQDLRFAARSLSRSPSFTVMALVCVALGVAVATTIFGAVNGILLRPLPYRDADRLVAIYARLADKNEHGVNVSYPDFLSWRDENRAFEGVGLWTWTTHTLSGDGEAERVEGAGVTAALFPLLGVRPLLGRTFTPEDELPGKDRVIVLGHGLWQRRFGGARDIVGRAITVDGASYTVIGVMPPRFAFPQRGHAWVPFPNDEWREGRSNRGYAGAIARLKPGVTLERAQADLDVISRRLARAYPKDNLGWDAEAIAMRDDLVGELRRPLLVFLGAVGLVLLIACANVANLMLARGAGRQREIAIRVALGAGRARVVRQVLAESLLLALAGGAAGALAARWGVRLIAAAFPDEVPFYIVLGVDPLVATFAVAVSLVAGLAFGFLPALRATEVDLSHSLRDGGRGDVGGARSARLRALLVVSEIALAVVLAAGATLLVRSYRALTGTTLGFDTRGILSARVSLPPARYGDAERRRVFWEQLHERVRAVPGVEIVGSAGGVPFSGWDLQASFHVDGRPAAKQGEELVAHYQSVSPGYFRAIGVPLVRGRMLASADRDSSVRVAVINEALARREFPGQDPVGRRLKVGDADSRDPWYTIVGVVGDFRHYRLPRPMGPAVYFPLLARPSYSQTLVIRTGLADPASIEGVVRAAIRALDPDVPAYQVQTFERMVSRSLWQPRLHGQVLGTFAALALLLAVVGVYGVISYAVAERAREFGVRMALGASRRQVMALVVRQGARLAALGAGIGLAAALALSRVVEALLHDVTATDPATFVAVPLGLAAVAVLASCVPALRATRVDPAVAIRGE